MRCCFAQAPPRRTRRRTWRPHRTLLRTPRSWLKRESNFPLKPKFLRKQTHHTAIGLIQASHLRLCWDLLRGGLRAGGHSADAKVQRAPCDPSIPAIRQGCANTICKRMSNKHMHMFTEANVVVRLSARLSTSLSSDPGALPTKTAKFKSCILRASHSRRRFFSATQAHPASDSSQVCREDRLTESALERDAVLASSWYSGNL